MNSSARTSLKAEEEKVLISEIQRLIRSKREYEERIARSHDHIVTTCQEKMVTLDENLEMLQRCLKGECGTSPSRADIAAINKIELEWSQLVSQRNALHADLARRTCVHPERKTKEKKDVYAGLEREIALLEARRAEINVRLFCSKRVHAIIKAVAA